GATSGSGARSLPASWTRGSDSSGMVSSCLRSRGQARPFGDIFPNGRGWRFPRIGKTRRARAISPANAPRVKGVTPVSLGGGGGGASDGGGRRHHHHVPGSGAHGAPGSGGRGADLTIPLAGPAAGEPGPEQDQGRQQQRREVEQGNRGRDDGRAAAGRPEQV